MIVLAEDNFIEIVSAISPEDPFACRIISQYNSYDSKLAFVDYWLIFDEENKIYTGAISRCGTNFILFLTDNSDMDEVSSFMRVAGASNAVCNGAYKLDLFGYKYISGVILRKNKPYEIIDNSLSIITPDIKDAYELLVKCADDNFTPPVFEDFYVDVNHKLRHNAMRIYGFFKDGELAAVAMTVAESDNGAVLGAVSCHPDYRKHGYGSSIVKYITNVLISENKSVYLHRAKNANQSFYSNLGFDIVGKWREYSFKG